MNTLILPEGVKEELIDDAREFLDSEEWYVWAGVPHRRGDFLLRVYPIKLPTNVFFSQIKVTSCTVNQEPERALPSMHWRAS